MGGEESSGDGKGAQADLRYGTALVGIRSVLLEKMVAKAPRERKIGWVWLPDPLGVKRAHNRIQKIAQQQPVEFMPPVSRSHKVEMVAVDGTKKPFQPRRIDVDGFRRDYRTGLRAQQFRGGHNRVQSGSSRRAVAGNCADRMQGAQCVHLR